jgi:uncharacterized protein (DUF2147 family)
MNGMFDYIRLLGSAVTTLIVCTVATAAPLPIEGMWRTIDDKTGFAKAIVKIERIQDGQVIGTIMRVIPRPDYTPKELCQNCPKPFTNQKILGMSPLWGLKPEDTNGTRYSGGFIIDPLSGRIYRSKAKLSPDGRRLTMRGYVGVSALGRTQTWIRETEDSSKLY